VTAVEHLLLQITQADIASDNATLSLKQLTFQMLNFLFHQSHGRICDCWSNYSQPLKLPDSPQQQANRSAVAFFAMVFEAVLTCCCSCLSLTLRCDILVWNSTRALRPDTAISRNACTLLSASASIAAVTTKTQARGPSNPRKHKQAHLATE